MTAVAAPAVPATAPTGGIRWGLLAAYSLLVACTQILWLTFATVNDQTERALHVSSGAVGLLAVVNPLLMVVLAIPGGRWMDRHYGRALATGALLTAGGALVRLVDTHSYAWVLAGQVVLSAGQPLVLNATTKIAARYFPPGERTTAVSIGSAAQFLGILVAALISGPLARHADLTRLLVVHAVLTTAVAAVVVAGLAVRPAYATEAEGKQPLGWLRRDPLMVRLGLLLFVGVGLFNAIATCLDPILIKLGHPNTAGPLIAITTVAGIAGAAVIPGLAAGRDRRREVLLLATGTTVVVFALIAAAHPIALVAVVLAVEGFVLLSCLPITLDWSELHVGAARAGTATGALLVAGNVGGVVVPLLVQAVDRNPYAALLVIAACAIPGLFVARGLPRHVERPEDLPAAEPSPAPPTEAAVAVAPTATASRPRPRPRPY